MGSTRRFGSMVLALALLGAIGCQRTGGSRQQGTDGSQVAYVDRSGKRATLADHRGKVVLVDVWATWCPPCRKSLPEVAELQRQAGSDLVVLPISVDEQGWKAVGPFLDENPSLGLVAYVPDGATGLKPFGSIPGIPTTVVLDRSGRVRERWSGFYPGRAEKAIKAALAEGAGVGVKS